MSDTGQNMHGERLDASPTALNRGEQGIPVPGDFLSMFERLVVAVETIAYSAGSKPRENSTENERIDRILNVIQSFGNIVPTYSKLAEKTGIPASTLNGMEPVRNALREARDRMRAERRAGQSFKSRTGDFEAWIDPEDAE